MCGFAGFIDPRGGHPELLADLASRMAGAVAHRGPDDAGTWVDPGAGVGLGFRRLSIIDLSAAGHQPMASWNRRYVLVMNGEIYNFPELRRELEASGVRFKGRSDTEVMLSGIERWGLERALVRATGMFALALWDSHQRRLFLARDRFGEKPLFYGLQGDAFLFGSELKALKEHPSFCSDIDRASLTDYFRYGYVPAPNSIYRGVKKVPPGAWLSFCPATRAVSDPYTYWSATDVASAASDRPFTLSFADSVMQLETELGSCVAQRMVADVPVGALLSGGLDSTAVVALMQQHSPSQVRTFTIGFCEKEYDESRWARAVARRLGTDHTELCVKPAEALAVIPTLPRVYDEPFADSSQIPTILVSRLARNNVEVVLTGDGADEIFGGYGRYPAFAALHTQLRRVPAPVAAGLGRWLQRVSGKRVAGLSPLVQRVAPLRANRLDDKVLRLGAILESKGDSDFRRLYREFISVWHTPSELVIGGLEHPSVFEGPRLRLADDPWQVAMLIDAVTYLPDDILTKVDRASMAVGLEARAPFLDPTLMEFAWRLPREHKVDGRRGKHVLRHLVYRRVGRELVDRPKMGFGVPIGHWLRDGLRAWAEELLSPDLLEAEGYLRADVVRRLWQRHISGEQDHKYELWAVLMFQAWLHEHHGTVGAAPKLHEVIGITHGRDQRPRGDQPC